MQGEEQVTTSAARPAAHRRYHGYALQVALGLRFIARALAVYLALTMLATIYLGWHFVVDLPAGVAIAYAAVFLGRWMIYPEHAPWRPDLRQGGRGSGGAPPRLQRGRAGRPR
jgi:hypothetical protein